MNQMVEASLQMRDSSENTIWIR